MAAEKETTANAIGKGKPGPGRPKGIPNKNTTILKTAALIAAQRAAGKLMGEETVESYLEWAAVEHPQSFMSMLTKILPTQVEGGGKDGEHVITIRWQS